MFRVGLVLTAMLSVFLSSTYLDLQPERNAVRDAVLRLRGRFAGMEYFGSDPERPIDVSLRFLASSDVYVGVIGQRYGTIDSATGKSITHLEYEHAKARRLPTLLYEKSVTARIEPTTQFIDFDPNVRQKLEEFKCQLRNANVVQTFVSAEDLAAKATADLAALALRKRSEVSTPEYTRRHTAPYKAADIPLVGPAAVGKTVYGCVLTNQPIAVAAKYGLSFEVDDAAGHLREQYECLNRGRWTSGTMPGDRRAVGAVKFRRKHFFGYREYCLRIVDTSGEEWRLASDGEWMFTKYQNEIPQELASCSGLIMFFDVPEPHRDWTDRVLRYDPQYAHFIALLAGAQPPGEFTKPLAVVLSKCDLRPDLLNSPEGASDYLHQTFPLAMAQIRHRVQTWRIFPVSAVGSVDPEGNPFAVQPVGLWDPIVWISQQI